MQYLLTLCLLITNCLWAAAIVAPTPDTVYQLQVIPPASDSGNAVMLIPKTSTEREITPDIKTQFVAIIKQYGFSDSAFGKHAAIYAPALEFQMPGLGAFVPTSLTAAATPTLGLQTPINFNDNNAAAYPLQMTVLMAKKRLREYNPNTTTVSTANPLGNQLFNTIFGANGIFPVDVRSHTERQLAKALLNRPDINAGTYGDIYIYTQENTCVNPDPSNDNQGNSCCRWYEALGLMFPNIKFHFFFRRFKGNILKNINTTQLPKLISFIEGYSGDPNLFQTKFPDYRINRGVLLTNHTLQEICRLLNKKQITKDDLSAIKTQLGSLNVTTVPIIKEESPTTKSPITLTNLELDYIQRSRHAATNRENIIQAATAACVWYPSTTEQAETFLTLISAILGNQSIPDDFIRYLKNGLMQALYGDTDKMTYHFVE